ncbi:MAG TPA: efflux RND transporter periplasmic adaptor subunit [Candidatus Methylacidiphilales bacterium]|nr:efflux RND transporter periplasmic adaptor subunit [Candidatus Methylacidiphilales bacterium]
MKKTSSRLLFLALATLFFPTACGPKEAAAPPPPPVVLVAEATEADVPIFSEAIATLNGFTNAQIHAQVSGYLVKQVYTEGSHVNQGDLLFQIDPKTFQADLDKAKADLASAQAQEIKAKQDLDRYAALVKSGAVSQQEYQNQTQNHDSAVARVQAAQAVVQTAQINLGYTQITAPISGVAGSALAQLGDLVSPSTELTTISTVDPIQAAFTITEQFYLNNADRIAEVSALPMEKRPESIELLLADGTPYPRKGRFYYIDRQIQVSTGAMTAYALFPNPDRLLRPGQYAKVRGVTQKIEGAVLVPQRAVNELQSLFQIVVIKPDNTAEIRNVTVGNQAGSSWIITSGLKAGEKVVVEGIQKCQNGQPVTPEPYVPGASSSTNTPPAPTGNN